MLLNWFIIFLALLAQFTAAADNGGQHEQQQHGDAHAENRQQQQWQQLPINNIWNSQLNRGIGLPDIVPPPNSTLISTSSVPSVNLPVCNSNSRNASNANVTVCVEGGWVSGMDGSYYSNVTVFKGIPYAAPPLADLRWKEPQPVNAWNGTRAANTFIKCAQVAMLPMGPNGPMQSTAPRNITGSEDCLYLNIWTTGNFNAKNNKQQQLRPVYVWIHGGGYDAGSGSDSSFNGEGLALKGLVVVTINYRLGVFGFLALPALSAESGRNASSNYGLLDQIAALKWVQRNIAAFGGDPNRVTIGGQSAGAGSCYMLTLSPLAAGLFKAAIPESGGLLDTQDPEISSLPSSHRTLTDAEQFGIAYFASINISADNLTTLRTLPMETLMNSTYADQSQITTWNGQAPSKRPVIDGYVIPRSYEQTLLLGMQNQVYMMMGHNHDEWGAKPALNYSYSEVMAIVQAKYGNMSSEFLQFYSIAANASNGAASSAANNAIRDNTRVSTYRWAQEWLKQAKYPLYTYFWNHSPPGTENSTGASHGSEIQYFFGNLYTDSSTNWTGADYAIADRMSSYVTNFVTNYNPNGPGLPQWPQQTNSSQQLFQLGDNCTQIAIANPLATKFDFLKRFYATQVIW